ncbi:hypothetical protein MNB_SV-3-876 [hydrothermal vent metagenome]|uniref:Hemerythrin-like domain-containing protein n=1 Tax=hydrothermal vent metagenome TaxID=652676 RepID=A0A1W1BDN0_9ZZZZ
MFGNLFLSKNQKLVKKWTKDHEEIVVLAHKVIAEYSKNNQKNAKKALKELNELAVDHVMNEDIEFYRLTKDTKRLTATNESMIHEFTKTFKGTKMALMNFLTKYTKDDVVLDEEFFTGFNGIVEVLGKRIEYEENNLYKILKHEA